MKERPASEHPSAVSLDRSEITGSRLPVRDGVSTGHLAAPPRSPEDRLCRRFPPPPGELAEVRCCRLIDMTGRKGRPRERLQIEEIGEDQKILAPSPWRRTHDPLISRGIYGAAWLTSWPHDSSHSFLQISRKLALGRLSFRTSQLSRRLDSPNLAGARSYAGRTRSWRIRPTAPPEDLLPV